MSLPPLVPESFMDGFIHLIDNINTATKDITRTDDMLSAVPVSMLLCDLVWTSNAVQFSSNHFTRQEAASLVIQSCVASMASDVSVIDSNLDTMLFDQAELAKHDEWMVGVCVYASNGIRTHIQSGASAPALWSSNYGASLSNLISDTVIQMAWTSNMLPRIGTLAEITWASNIGTGAYNTAVTHWHQLDALSMMLADLSNTVCRTSNQVSRMRHTL